MSFFQSDFKFERYINERLIQVQDEGERRMLKELIRETLIPFYNETENSYKELEKKITNDEMMHKRYEIITSVSPKKLVDVTEEAMVPMNMADLGTFVVDLEKVKEALENNQLSRVMKILFKADTATINKVLFEARKFKGIIYTSSGEYPAVFSIQRNTEYIEQLEQIYKVFENNDIPWNTVCAPFLYKYFDVMLESTDCKFDEEISRIVVDFCEYKQYVEYDMVPMWNVRVLEEKSGTYPDFAVDQIHYEHVVYGSRFKDNRDYLVGNTNTKLWDIFRQDGDMHIVCDIEEPTRWNLLELCYEAHDNTYDEPVFGNYCVHKSNRCLHTVAEIRNYVLELGYTEYMKLDDVRCESASKPYDNNTYSMNEFIKDNIRNGLNRTKLVFKFRAVNNSNYLNNDILSYIMSCMQWQLPEFECIGELI